MNYVLAIGAYTCISLIGIMGCFLLTGLTGLFSLGQAAMMSMGAYIGTLFCMKLGLPVSVCILVSLAATGVISWLLSFIALKVKQAHFAIATLGFSEAIKAYINYDFKFTGGANGIREIPITITWWMALIALVAVIAVVAMLKRSDFGRRCRAVRDNEMAAEVLGVPVFRHKMSVYIISSVITALAGCLYAFYQGFIGPDIGSWLKSAEWIIIVFVGGRNSITGVLITGVVLLIMPELLRFANEWRTIIYGVIVILTISFRPEGLLGKWEFSLPAIGRRFRRLLGIGSSVGAAGGGDRDA